MCKEGAYWGKIAIKIDGLYFVHAVANSLSVFAVFTVCLPCIFSIFLLWMFFVQELLPEYMLEWSTEWKGSVAPGIG